MDIRIFPSALSGQPRAEAVSNKINGNVNEEYRLLLDIDEVYDGKTVQVIINGNSYPLVDRTYFDVPAQYMNANYLQVQFRFLDTTAFTSNTITFTIMYETGLPTTSDTMTDIPNFPETSTTIKLDETFKVNGNIYICKLETVVPDTIDAEWLNTNFHINYATTPQSSTEDYEALTNLPVIGGKIVEGVHTADYYGAYVKPVGGIPSADLNPAIPQSITTAQQTANTASQTATTASQTATNASNLATQAKEQSASVADQLGAVNQDIIDLNNALNDLDGSLQPDGDGNLPITKLPKIPTKTVLANMTDVIGQPTAYDVNNLPVGVIPDKHIVLQMLAQTIQDALAKANTAIQSLPTASTSVQGIVQLNTDTGAAAYSSLLELQTSLTELEATVNEILNTPVTKPENGWAYNDLSVGVQQTLDLASSSIQSLPDGTDTNKGIVKLGASGGAATFESVNDLSNAVGDKMDMVATPTVNKMLKTDAAGQAVQSAFTDTEVADALEDVTLLMGSDTTSGSVSNRVKIETDRATMTESELQNQVNLTNQRINSLITSGIIFDRKSIAPTVIPSTEVQLDLAAQYDSIVKGTLITLNGTSYIKVDNSAGIEAMAVKSSSQVYLTNTEVGTGVGATFTVRLYSNTSASTSGATLLATVVASTNKGESKTVTRENLLSVPTGQTLYFYTTSQSSVASALQVNDGFIEWTQVASTGGGSGGTTDHALLGHLDYASSGHTGFASASDITGLQGQIDAIDLPVPTANDAGKVLGVDDAGKWVLVAGGGGEVSGLTMAVSLQSIDTTTTEPTNLDNVSLGDTASYTLV